LAGAAASKKVTEVSKGTMTVGVGLLGVVPDMSSYKTSWGFCLSK
jgi:hypothetical protein